MWTTIRSNVIDLARPMLLRMIGVPYFTSAQLVRTLKVWPLGRIREIMVIFCRSDASECI